jgi:hypothetical protein
LSWQNWLKPPAAAPPLAPAPPVPPVEGEVDVPVCGVAPPVPDCGAGEVEVDGAVVAGAVDVPVEPAAVPPLPPDVPADDEVPAPDEAPVDVEVVPVVVVDEADDDVAPWARASAPAGTVSGGADAGMRSTPVLSPPQPAAPAESARAAKART